MLRIAIQNFLLKPTYKHQFSNPDCYTTIQHLYYCLFAQIGINLVYNKKYIKKNAILWNDQQPPSFFINYTCQEQKVCLIKFLVIVAKLSDIAIHFCRL